jgi:phage-related protein/predicted XRE-type DNA-binding protein
MMAIRLGYRGAANRGCSRLFRRLLFFRAVQQQLGFALLSGADRAEAWEREDVARLCRNGLAGACDDPGGICRAVFVVQFKEAVYVLHAFQKKAKSRIATPQRELDLIRQRLQLARKRTGKKGDWAMPIRNYVPSSGNVFADLNLLEADDLLAKAELAARIIAEIRRRRITQAQTAAILGIDRPKISALKQGKLTGFSIERLMRFLLLLGRDIQITVKERAGSRSMARLRVAWGQLRSGNSATAGG